MTLYETSTRSHHALRRTNRRSFLEKTYISNADNYSASVLMLCYNDTEQFFRALDHLEKDPQRNSFTVAIVQNSDREDSLRAFEEHIKNYTNISVLYPIQNVGSAGGYALGQEYLLENGCEHIVMLEDDVELLETDTISSMLTTARTHKDIVFIEHPINAGGDHSWYVQCACYPAELIRAAGIIDPRFYFRAEDLERGKRIEDTIKRDGYQKVVVNKHYYHPYLKGVNNSGSWIYFSIRNQLWSYSKHRQGAVRLMLTISQYAAFALLVFFRSGKSLIGTCLRHALKDGTGRYKPLEYHKKMIDFFGTYKKTGVQDMGFSAQPADIELIKQGVDISHFVPATTIAQPDRTHLSKYRGRLLVSGGFQPVRGTLLACVRKVFVIESLYREKNIVAGKLLSQGGASQIVNLLLFLPCALLGGLIGVASGIRFLGTVSLKK